MAETEAAHFRAHEVDDLRDTLLARLRHYFPAYKQSPDTDSPACEITDVYGRDAADEVIRRSMKDYEAHYA